MALLDVNRPNFQSVLALGFTQAQFITWIKEIMSYNNFPTPVETVGTNPKIIAWNLDFTLRTGSSIDNYWYCIYIPTVTTSTNFTIYQGLFQFNNYNTTTFLRTASYIGAYDSKTNTDKILSTSSFIFNNNNSYQSINFGQNTEFIGSFIRINSSENPLCFLGVSIPETIYSHINKNNNCSVMMVSEPNIYGTSNSKLHFPSPCLNSNSASSSGHYRVINYQNISYVSHLTGGIELFGDIPIICYNNNPAISGVIGKYPPDIKFGTTANFGFGSILQINPGVEEYFVCVSNVNGWVIRTL